MPNPFFKRWWWWRRSGWWWGWFSRFHVRLTSMGVCAIHDAEMHLITGANRHQPCPCGQAPPPLSCDRGPKTTLHDSSQKTLHLQAWRC